MSFTLKNRMLVVLDIFDLEKETVDPFNTDRLFNANPVDGPCLFGTSISCGREEPD